MKKPAAAPKPKAKLGNLFGDGGDSDESLAGGLKKPPAKKGLPAMPPSKPIGRKNTFADSDDENDFKPSPSKASAPGAKKVLPNLPASKPKAPVPAAAPQRPKPPAPKAEQKNDADFKANLANLIGGPRPARPTKKVEAPKAEPRSESIFVSVTDSAQAKPDIARSKRPTTTKKKLDFSDSDDDVKKPAPKMKAEYKPPAPAAPTQPSPQKLAEPVRAESQMNNNADQYGAASGYDQQQQNTYYDNNNNYDN